MVYLAGDAEPPATISAPSSRGLGRRPLKAVTPVRIRSGLHRTRALLAESASRRPRSITGGRPPDPPVRASPAWGRTQKPGVVAHGDAPDPPVRASPAWGRPPAVQGLVWARRALRSESMKSCTPTAASRMPSEPGEDLEDALVGPAEQLARTRSHTPRRSRATSANAPATPTGRPSRSAASRILQCGGDRERADHERQQHGAEPAAERVRRVSVVIVRRRRRSTASCGGSAGSKWMPSTSPTA